MNTMSVNTVIYFFFPIATFFRVCCCWVWWFGRADSVIKQLNACSEIIDCVYSLFGFDFVFFFLCLRDRSERDVCHDHEKMRQSAAWKRKGWRSGWCELSIYFSDVSLAVLTLRSCCWRLNPSSARVNAVSSSSFVLFLLFKKKKKTMMSRVWGVFGLKNLRASIWEQSCDLFDFFLLKKKKKKTDGAIVRPP